LRDGGLLRGLRRRRCCGQEEEHAQTECHECACTASLHAAPPLNLCPPRGAPDQRLRCSAPRTARRSRRAVPERLSREGQMQVSPPNGFMKQRWKKARWTKTVRTRGLTKSCPGCTRKSGWTTNRVPAGQSTIPFGPIRQSARGGACACMVAATGTKLPN